MPSLPYHGVVPILATPFSEDESLDTDSLARLVGFMRRLRCEAVTVLGVLGENDRLSDAERLKVVETAVAAAGAMPVIVGASRPTGDASRKFIERSQTLGAAGAMVAPPAPDAFGYFQEAARAGLPLVIQDHPASTGVPMPVPFLLRLVSEVDGVAGVKCEATPSPTKIAALKAGMDANRRVPVLTGLGALYGRFDLERGSDGFNTGFAFPEVLRAMLGPHRNAVYARFLPLLVFEQQPGVAIRKEILRRRGLLSSNRVRRPGESIDPPTARQLDQVLSDVLGASDLSKPLPEALLR